MDKITVVCHKDHVVGYEDYAGKCLLCEVERLQNREWVGLTGEEIHEVVSKKWWDWEDAFDIEGFSRAIEAKLKEKNT